MTARDQRTLRFAAIGIACYLALFYGVRGWRHLENTRADYLKLQQEAARLTREFQSYENKILLAAKLRESFHIDTSKWTNATLAAETSAAIQKAATSGGIQLGPIRETASRSTGKELASIQIEGFGPVPAVLAFLHRIETSGFPVLLNAIQLSSDPMKPGMIKVNLTLVILDFERWKPEEARNV